MLCSVRHRSQSLSLVYCRGKTNGNVTGCHIDKAVILTQVPGEPHEARTVLITGIGCIGKSTLRQRVADALGDRVVCVDRDEDIPDPSPAPGQALIVESVHGLEEPPVHWNLVVYLQPPPGHILRWLRRGFAWFRTGKVDRPPRTIRRPWSLLNIPLIVRLVLRNILLARRWVGEDLQHIKENHGTRAIIAEDASKAFKTIIQFIAKEIH